MIISTLKPTAQEELNLTRRVDEKTDATSSDTSEHGSLVTVDIPLQEDALSPKESLVAMAKQNGWRLIRLNGKIPMDKGWTNSPGLNREEALEHPGNLGIICGEPSNRLFIVDIDGNRPDGLPKTPTVVTGSGGLHLYYRLPEHIQLAKANKVNHVAESVDIRWTGGQIVAPGSVHPETGALYVWGSGLSPEDVPIADVPDWVISKLQENTEQKSQPTSVKVEVADTKQVAAMPAAEHSRYLQVAIQQAANDVRNAPVGNRNDTLNTKAYSLGGFLELTDEEITVALLKAAVDAGLPIEEARKTINSGISGGRKQPRTLSTSQPAENCSDVHSWDSLESFKASRCTDVANGQRFERKFAGKVLHTDSLGWLVWDGKRFARNPKEARELAKTISDDIQYEIIEMMKGIAPGDQQAMQLFHQIGDALNKWAKSTASTRGLDNLLTEARTTPRINGNALDFDADPWLLNCQNGTLDLRTGDLVPHDPKYLMTKLLPIDYDPHAKCQRWDQFLHEVFQGNLEIIEYVKRALSYSLSGDTSWQVWFLLHGSGANGKSRLVDVLRQVLGADYSHEIDPEELCQQPWAKHTTERAALIGVRYLTSEETDEGRQLAEAFVKALTGGGKLRARFMRQDSFEFEPKCKLWLSTNNKPIVKDTSPGFWRRVRIIPFKANFSNRSDCDPKLNEKLAAEAPGILAQLVQYARVAYQEGEGVVPAGVMDATDQYRTDSDTLGEFLLEHTTEASPQERLMKAKLYSAYLAATGGKCESMAKFNARVKARGITDARTKHGAAWVGLRLVDPKASQKFEATNDPGTQLF